LGEEVMHSELIESIVIEDRKWFKIKEDTAFESILEGYAAYEKVWNGLLKTKKVAVQAGGYCGVFPRLLAESFHTVYTFEPDPLNFFCLTLNCQTDNVIKANGALGNVYGLVDIVRTNPHNKGMNVVKVSETSSIPTYRIDDLGLKECDLIALDTEGYEYEILRGASSTIDWFRPVITVEDPNPGIDALLASKGYKLQTMIHNRDAVYSV
jgi:FkbM family methyltransferase